LLLPRGGIDDGLGTRARLGRGLLLSLPCGLSDGPVRLWSDRPIDRDAGALLELRDRSLGLRAEVAIDGNLHSLRGEELLQGSNILSPRPEAEEWQVFHWCGILFRRDRRRAA
jgi:hypothetical protein